MQKKTFYPDRYNLSKWYLGLMAIFVIAIGFKVHFSSTFYIVVIPLLLNVIIMGAMFRVAFNLDDRTVTARGADSLISKVSIDNIDYQESDIHESRIIVLTDRVTNKSVTLMKDLFTESTLNEICMIIKTKTIL